MSTLRIIAGQLKGRRIPVPSGCPIRPTADRVREALFSILGEGVLGCRVLDAYAGTGALGFEALSRGAEDVVFIESDQAAAAALRAVSDELDVGGRCTVIEQPALTALAEGRARGPFGLIVADPPYDRRSEARAFLLAAVPHLGPGGRIVAEREGASIPADAPGLTLVRTARYGRTCLDFYRPAPVSGRKTGPGPS